MYISYQLDGKYRNDWEQCKFLNFATNRALRVVLTRTLAFSKLRVATFS